MSAVPALCLAPDGWHLLSGGRDKVVCVWDIRNGSRVATLPVYEALEGKHTRLQLLLLLLLLLLFLPVDCVHSVRGRCCDYTQHHSTID
jgi:WD40 repeat protein